MSDWVDIPTGGKQGPIYRVAKRGLLWEWQSTHLIGGPLGPYAHVWPRSRFYYRDHGFAFTRSGAQRAAERSWARQKSWMERWNEDPADG